MKKVLNFLVVASVFIINILLLIFSKSSFGFGLIIIAFLGIIITYLGLGIWLWGFISLGTSFALFTKADKLVKKGIYKYLKHPIYIGIFLTFTGIALAEGSFWGLLFNIVATSPLNIIRARSEEKALSKKFSTY